MSLQVDVLAPSNVFVCAYRLVEVTIYKPGTTAQMIADDPNVNRQNITGWELEWNLRMDSEDKLADAVITKSTLAANPLDLIVIDDATTGSAHFELWEADSLNIPPGQYWYTTWRPEVPGVLTFGVWVFREPARRE